MLPYLAGWLVIMVVFAVTQARFYDAHQRAHGLWRPRSTPLLLAYSPEERRAMLRATTRRDANPAVEQARWHYVLVLAFAVAYLVIGFPLALLFFA